MAYRESLLSLLSTVTPLRRIVEIGVHRGRTSAAILSRFPDATLYMIDPWLPYRDGERQITEADQAEARRIALEVTAPYSERRIVIDTDSRSALSQVPICDAVFVDGDHSYEGVWEDLAWWDKVRLGGIFCGHDYGKSDIPGVTRAVDEFAAERGLAVHVAEGHIWWMTRWCTPGLTAANEELMRRFNDPCLTNGINETPHPVPASTVADENVHRSPQRHP